MLACRRGPSQSRGVEEIGNKNAWSGRKLDPDAIILAVIISNGWVDMDNAIDNSDVAAIIQGVQIGAKEDAVSQLVVPQLPFAAWQMRCLERPRSCDP